jgi:pimeloyl-ACP methyl ester carboxylesterase
MTIYYKDWGDKGYRVIAHDRRGHGRSSQVSDDDDQIVPIADSAPLPRSSSRRAP